jgi:hypothetical protein
VAHEEPTDVHVTERFVAPSPESLDRVKGEITFFMEKTFQISFGYFGALVALGAASGLDASAAVASELGIGTAVLFCTAILLFNAVYLSLASGTLFATIKRGLFLIKMDPNALGHRQWETFVRSSGDETMFRPRALAFAAWNLDNFYMTPLFALIGLVSVVTAIVGIREADGALGQAVLLLAVTIHIVPLGMLAMTGQLASHTTRTVSPATVNDDDLAPML